MIICGFPHDFGLETKSSCRALACLLRERHLLQGGIFMAIKLYDAVPSSNSDRVKIALHEKGLPYERVTLNLAKKDQKRPEFLKLNPYGKVPVIDEDGKVLFESCIINEYLDEKYPNPPLTPKDPYLRGRGRVLIDYALNYVHEPYWALRGEMLKTGSRARCGDRRGKTPKLTKPSAVS
jgi:glutathione S-transferase